MEMKVHCPACSRALRVPKAASGRKARCPSCKRVFTIPAVEELFDETVSTWIEDDVEQMIEESDQKWEEVASIKAYQEHHDHHSASSVNLREEYSEVGNRHAENDVEQLDRADSSGSHESLDDSTSANINANKDATADSTILGRIVEDDPPISKEPSSPKTVAKSPSDLRRPASATSSKTAGRSGTSGTTSGGVAVGADDVFPTDLYKEPNAPHLTVTQCNQNGVTFAFDERHLEHRGFRVSMPIACAFSGETDRERIVARPLAFIDQSAAVIRNALEVEDKHATHLLAGQTPNDLLDIMGTIASLPKPFKFPLPYYAAPEHTKESIKCTTKKMNDDHVICFVTIPDPKIALQWLLHVNGVCGIEYGLLQHEVSLLENLAWGALSDICRQRLSIWCPFEPKERFQHYLSDADFGKKDRGLAGLVITDSRLIYCKYHHRGHIQLDEPGTIRVKLDDNFAHLSFQSERGKTKLVKLHTEDISSLVEALELFPDIKIEQQ